MDHSLFDRLGTTLTTSVFIASILLFGTQTGEWGQSLFAALMAAGLFWISYVVIRWVVLALRK
jgi:hypothetical protein